MPEGTQKGFVSLVGAGPGDPELLTIKGLRRLQEADVVIYDYLANPELLKHCRPDAQLIFAGKQAGKHSAKQEEINAWLLEHGRAGRRVVRLKGGDPFVFGRGGEEAEVLVQAGIPWEVVPGVTSAIAAPAYAGIPVTHRDWASSFIIVTGHESPEKLESTLYWEHLARSGGTLVFLMGVGRLPFIVERLVAAGRTYETPAAVIHWGTKSNQQVVVGTLETIAGLAEGAGIKPPAITVVGDVVRLRESLRWFDTRPLFGRRVVVTRAREQASALSQRLAELGATPIEYPVIAFEATAPGEPLDEAVLNLGRYDWVLFTSANGVRFLLERLRALGQEITALQGVRLGAIGPATAAELERAQLRPAFVPSEYVAEAVVEQIGDVAGQRILLPRADIAREALPQGLAARGALVEDVVAYRTVLGDAGQDIVALLRAGQVDAVTFTSSSTVRNFLAKLEQAGVGLAEAQALLGQVTIAAIGPITAATAREHGLAVTIEAEHYTVEGLVEKLVSSFEFRVRGRVD